GESGGDQGHWSGPGNGATDRLCTWRPNSSFKQTGRRQHFHDFFARDRGSLMTRILVVEDEQKLAMGLEGDLKMEGYEVAVQKDGEAASRRAREGEFDLVILDVMLPKKDGFEVCRELRRAGLKTPVILLTAKTQESDKVLGLELGADDYVTKPFSPRE